MGIYEDDDVNVYDDLYIIGNACHKSDYLWLLVKKCKSVK